MSDISSTLAAMSKGIPLGNFSRCPICREYDWDNIHECAKAWLAVSEYCDEDCPEIVYCDGTSKHAAERYAEQIFPLLDYPHEIKIKVSEDNGETWEKYSVTVESVPSFTATEIEEAQS